MSFHKYLGDIQEKNRHSSGDDDTMSLGSQSSDVGSPEMSTPTKRRATFDFWNKSPSDEEAGPSVNKRLRFDDQRKLKISDITPGRQTNAAIEFRTTLISNQKGTPQCDVFKMHGMDASGEISFVAYRNEAKACREFFELNKVYSLENLNVKTESQQFPSGTGHSSQIVIEQYSIRKELTEDGTIPEIHFEFVSLNEVGKLDAKTKIDALGILVMDYGHEVTKSGVSKRDIVITDKSKANIVATLWKAAGENFSGEVGKVVALKKVSVGKFDGNVCLNANHDTLIWVNPAIGRAAELLDWFNEEVNKMKE